MRSRQRRTRQRGGEGFFSSFSSLFGGVPSNQQAAKDAEAAKAAEYAAARLAAEKLRKQSEAKGAQSGATQ
jgi:hypothetical protein